MHLHALWCILMHFHAQKFEFFFRSTFKFYEKIHGLFRMCLIRTKWYSCEPIFLFSTLSSIYEIVTGRKIPKFGWNNAFTNKLTRILFFSHSILKFCETIPKLFTICRNIVPFAKERFLIWRRLYIRIGIRILINRSWLWRKFTGNNFITSPSYDKNNVCKLKFCRVCDFSDKRLADIVCFNR